MSTNSEAQAAPATGDSQTQQLVNVTVKALDGTVLLQDGSGSMQFPFLTCGTFTQPTPGYPEQSKVYDVKFALADTGLIVEKQLHCQASGAESTFG